MSLEQVVQQMPAAVIIVEAPSGRIIHANARAQDMTIRQLGRSIPAELVQDWEIFHPDGRPYQMDEWPLVRSITTGEEVVDEEYFNTLPDGSRLSVRCNSSPVYDDDGRIVAGVLVMDDITERKRGEEQRAHHAGLVENMEDAVIATDERFLVTAWNRGAERLYGRRAEEVLGRPVQRVVQTDRSDAEWAGRLRLLSEEGRSRVELVAYRKDGTPVDVELITVAIPGERGEITGYLGIHRDVSERKRAERRLREAGRRTEAILDTITDTFSALDAEWRYTYLNQRAIERVVTVRGDDVTVEDFLGRNCWELHPELVGTTFYHEFHRAVREQKTVAFETYSPASGLWLGVKAYPSKDGGLYVFTHDTTERKLGEQARERSARQQALVADLGLRALASDDLQTLMEEAVGLVALALDAELVGIAEALPGQDRLLLRAGVGWNAGTVGSQTAGAGPGSLLDFTTASGDPVVSEDFAADERFEISELLSEHGVVSGATVVIAGPDGAFGSLGAFSTQPHSLSEHDANFLQAVANVLATAAERTQSSEKMREVREAERRRLARELHDEGLQELTHALSLAQGLRTGSSEPRAAHPLVPALKRVSQQLRGAIYNLRLDEESNRPFPERLEALVALHRAMAVDSDIEVHVAGEDAGGPLGQPGTELLRIVGEALTNARRHAGAQSIGVVARWSETELFVEVSDDGRGFNSDALSEGPGGTGIAGMRERANLVRADLSISSELHAGTAVRVRLPLRKDDEPVAQIRVLLVEDHAAVREAIAAMFEREPDFEVAGQAASLAEARGMLEEVDLAVVDLRLPDGHGGDLIAELLAVNRQAQALVLSASLDRADIALAIESGAAGALEKTAHLDEVVQAARRLQAGETLIPLDEVLELLRFAETRREQEHADRAAIEQLTPREREVLRAFAQGLNSQAIADRLHITLRTERNHVANILGKLGVHSRLQALVFALRYELVEIS